MAAVFNQSPRAWRAREQFEERTSFRNWLYRIATNACLNALASRPKARRVLQDRLVGVLPGDLERWDGYGLRPDRKLGVRNGELFRIVQDRASPGKDRKMNLGRLVVEAVLARDYPVIQALILLFSFFYVIVNLIVDMLYTVFDPRIRY